MNVEQLDLNVSDGRRVQLCGGLHELQLPIITGHLTASSTLQHASPPDTTPGRSHQPTVARPLRTMRFIQPGRRRLHPLCHLPSKAPRVSLPTSRARLNLQLSAPFLQATTTYRHHPLYNSL